jgi:hypothetical protein
MRNKEHAVMLTGGGVVAVIGGHEPDTATR